MDFRNLEEQRIHHECGEWNIESEIAPKAPLNKSVAGGNNLCVSPRPLRERVRVRGKKAAFTLAEVLITLGIIGIVAAMTMPTLIQKHQEHVNSVKLKKFYSMFSQAVELAKVNHGDISEWSAKSDKLEAAYDWLDILGKNLKIVKICTPDTTNDCLSKSQNLSGNNILDTNLVGKTGGERFSTVAFVLNNGEAIRMNLYSVDCSFEGSELCAQIDVDINGKQKPNVYGKDLFSFMLIKSKFLPYGHPSQFDSIDELDTYFHTYCSINSNDPSNGSACPAWVITFQNMDYLRCPDDLSWSGIHKCK